MTRTAATRQSHLSRTSTPTGGSFPRSVAHSSSASSMASDANELPITEALVGRSLELEQVVWL